MNDVMVQLADFGLSRVLENNCTHVSTSSYGTVAYMPAGISCKVLSLPQHQLDTCQTLHLRLSARPAYLSIMTFEERITSMTYAYLHLPSAELLQDGRVTRATDIYSFAMIMMELYTGRQLFEGLRSQQVAGPVSFFGLCLAIFCAYM